MRNVSIADGSAFRRETRNTQPVTEPTTSNKPPEAMSITCHQCHHYYVTWEPQFPHGCRIMGFKSRQMPVIEVRRTMGGKDCLHFEIKKANNPQPIFQDRR